IKKPRPSMVQREPIFFSHAERVGYGATGNWVGDDLPQTLLYYHVFKSFVRDAYTGRHLDAAATADAVRKLPGHGVAFYASLPPEENTARIDFFDARFRQYQGELLERYGRVVQLGDLVEPVMRVSP